MNSPENPDLMLHNDRIATLNPKYPEANHLVIKDGKIINSVSTNVP